MGMAIKSTMPPLPSKPCRRLLVFTLAWSCLCFLVFRVYYNQGPDGIISPGGDSSLNTRELLQQEMVTRANQRLSTIGSLPPSALRSSKFDELMIDRSPKKSDKEVLSELERQLPNLPLVYLLDKKGFHYKNKTCAKFPTI
jgi:hypothetical protein